MTDLLQFDPKKRPTCVQALQHPYFKNASSPQPKPMNTLRTKSSMARYRMRQSDISIFDGIGSGQTVEGNIGAQNNEMRNRPMLGKLDRTEERNGTFGSILYQNNNNNVLDPMPGHQQRVKHNSAPPLSYHSRHSVHPRVRNRIVLAGDTTSDYHQQEQQEQQQQQFEHPRIRYGAPHDRRSRLRVRQVSTDIGSYRSDAANRDAPIPDLSKGHPPLLLGGRRRSVHDAIRSKAGQLRQNAVGSVTPVENGQQDDSLYDFDQLGSAEPVSALLPISYKAR